MAEIILHNGEVCLIDDEDEERTKPHRWYLSTKGYVVASAFPRPGTMMLHRFLMEVEINENVIVKFRNGNRLDCRKANLFITNKHDHPSNPKGRPRKVYPDVVETETTISGTIINKKGEKEFRELRHYPSTYKQ